jgi:hypothetical protein
LQNCQLRPVTGYFITRWQVRSPIWNVPINSKGELEHVALVSVEFVPLFVYTAFTMQVSKHITVVPHSYSPDWSLCCLLFLRTKLQLWGHHFQDVFKIYEQLLTVPQTGPKSVPLVLPAVAEILGTVHKLGGEPLEKREQWLVRKVNVQFVTVSVREPSVMSLYCPKTWTLPLPSQF